MKVNKLKWQNHSVQVDWKMLFILSSDSEAQPWDHVTQQNSHAECSGSKWFVHLWFFFSSSYNLRFHVRFSYSKSYWALVVHFNTLPGNISVYCTVFLSCQEWIPCVVFANTLEGHIDLLILSKYFILFVFKQFYDMLRFFIFWVYFIKVWKPVVVCFESELWRFGILLYCMSIGYFCLY